MRKHDSVGWLKCPTALNSLTRFFLHIPHVLPEDGGPGVPKVYLKTAGLVSLSIPEDGGPGVPKVYLKTAGLVSLSIPEDGGPGVPKVYLKMAGLVSLKYT